MVSGPDGPTHALGYGCKTRRMSRETQDKLAQREATVVYAWSKFVTFPVKFCSHKEPGGRNSNADGQFVTFASACPRLPFPVLICVGFTLLSLRF